MKTAAIYARVSTADQVKGTSLDGQIEGCRSLASDRGYIVVKEVREDRSGARLDRPGLSELRDMAAKGEIQALIVFDPDRLSRSLAHTMLLVEEFERRRAELLFVNAPKEDTPEGRMLFGLRGLFAEYEREKIRERTRRGKERTVRGGSIPGGTLVPYGYRHERIDGRGCYVLEEAEAVIVRQMFEWVGLDRSSLHGVAHRLNDMSVPTKRGGLFWRKTSVQKILKNVVYTGTAYWNRTESAEPQNPRTEGPRKKLKSTSVLRDPSQ